jgi:hypothetical protein
VVEMIKGLGGKKLGLSSCLKGKLLRKIIFLVVSSSSWYHFAQERGCVSYCKSKIGLNIKDIDKNFKEQFFSEKG